MNANPSKNPFKFIGCAGIGIFLIALVMWAMGVYNNMVKQEELVEEAWGQVENVYQRRYDLIPNLVNVVKGYAAHEKETFEAVIQARSEAMQTNINIDDLNEESMQQFQQSQGELSSMLSRLMVVVEAYPELKADKSFLELQSQLEGTENRITVERQRFNVVARDYNTTIRKFPGNIIAMIFGFEKKPYFKSEEGADKAPVVDFE
jgi:LemA protein